MPTPKLKGYAGRILQSRTTRFDPTNGETVSVDWASVGAGLQGYASTLRRMGVPFEHTLNGVRSTLTETASDAIGTGSEEVVTVDRWDVLLNEEMLDIKYHPNWTALPIRIRTCVLRNLGAFQDGKKAAGDGWIHDDSTGDRMYMNMASEFNAINNSTETLPEITSPQLSNAFDFFQHMIRGVSHYPVPRWVLRHTTNAAASYTQNVADDGVGSVYTTSQLISEISNSSYWVYPCPPRLRSKLAGFTLPSAPGISVGWLKKPSMESSAANNRIDISTEYHFSQWASIIYG